jgi:hypothetical protein
MPPEKKPESKPAEQDAFVEIVSMIFVLFIVSTVVTNILHGLEANRLFQNGWRGLTPRAVLISHTRPINSLANPIGAKVVSINNTPVYGSPNGTKIGNQKINARGTILQGPVDIAGDRYWYVDYNKDPDGWVKEGDIAYLESEPNYIESVFIGFLNFYFYLKIFLIFLSIIFVVCTIYLYRKITEMRINEDKLLFPKNPEVLEAHNPKWQHILDLMNSNNVNDWKQAILGADIMLSDILDRMALPGDTMGDKLKSINKGDFPKIDDAWEAHKIRNQIAHEGSDFILTQHEALRILNLYKAIFEDFKLI